MVEDIDDNPPSPKNPMLSKKKSSFLDGAKKKLRKSVIQ
jgi:hypothetical protein